jgi:aspartate/methionine/tyrosine aminotransferase
MKIQVFELERVQSIYENTVDYNLTESGFHPLTLSELLSGEQIDELTQTTLGYGQTNGSIALRERIAGLYDGQSIDNVLVTNGSAEANFIACHTLLEAGDEVVMMVPSSTAWNVRASSAPPIASWSTEASPRRMRCRVFALVGWSDQPRSFPIPGPTTTIPR